MKWSNIKKILFLLLFFLMYFVLFAFSQDTTPPALSGQINNQTIPEDQHFRLEFNLNVIFSDESPLTFSVNLNNANWLANVGDSVLIGFPLEEHVGDYNISVKATDTSGNTNSTSFTITVTAVDDKPIVLKNLPGQLQRPGFGEIKINYKGTFYDEEDKSLNYAVESSYPAVVTASIVGDSIVITERGIGPAEIILTATDSDGNKTETKMFIRIYEEAEVLNMTTANTGSNGLFDSNASCVRNDFSGNIWVGHKYGISRHKDGKWEQFPLRNGNFGIYEIWDDGQGNIFFITLYSIIKYSNQEFSTIDIVEDGNRLNNIMCSYITDDNTLYLAGYTREEEIKFLVIKNTGDQWETIYSEDKNEDIFPIFSHNMCVDNEDNIWIANQRELTIIKDGIRTESSVKDSVAGILNVLDVDIFGQIWIATSGGVYRYNPNEKNIERFTYWGTQTMLTDNIGNVWLGASGPRVFRIKDDKLFQVNLNEPILNDYTDKGSTINHISKTNDGRYWFCSENGFYISENLLLKDESTIIQHTFDGLPSNEINDIQRDPNGIYWFDTYKGISSFSGSKWNYHGLLQLHTIDQSGRKLCNSNDIFTIIDEDNNTTDYGPEITKTTHIQDITYDRNQNIWISGYGEYGLGKYGLVKFDGKEWTRYNTDDGLLYNFVGELMVDSKGNIWLDYYHHFFDVEKPDRVISKFDGNTFTHFYDPLGVGELIVKDFLEDLDGNIWMTTRDGVFKFDGENWSNYNSSNGLKCNFTETLALDHARGVWITYLFSHGVARYDGTKFDHFTTADGLPSNNINRIYIDHALTNQNKSGSLNKNETSDLIWLSSGDKGAANFYLQNATSVIDQSLPKMEAIIFPNPTQGITNIILDNQKRKYLDIEVLSIDGRKVYQNKTSNLTNKVQVNISSNPPGAYFVRLKSDIDSVVKKIILN